MMESNFRTDFLILYVHINLHALTQKCESLLIENHPEGLGATGHQYTGNT